MTGAAGMAILKTICSLSSMFMNLSPMSSMYRIHENKSCGEVQLLPLLSLWGSQHIWTLYGFLSSNIFPLFLTCLTGSVLAVGYITMYVRYTLERAQARKMVAGVLLWNALVLVLALSGESCLGITTLSNVDTGKWIGYLAAATSIVLYASPFATLARVVRTKSVASIPIEMVVVGALTNAIWVVYGTLDSDEIVAVTNAVCVVFGCVQTVVYIVVRRQQRTVAATCAFGVNELMKKDLTGVSVIELDHSDTAVVMTDRTSSSTLAFHALHSPV